MRLEQENEVRFDVKFCPEGAAGLVILPTTLNLYSKYLNEHRKLGFRAKTSHYRQSYQWYILDWGLAAPDPVSDILSALNKNTVNIVRATCVYTRYVRVNKSQLPPLQPVGSVFFVCRYTKLVI